MSLKDQILAAGDLPTEVVDVPEWDLKLTVRGLSSGERDKYYISRQVIRGGEVVGNDSTNATAKLLVLCIVDDDGKLVFGPEHAEVLAAKSAAALDRLWKVAARLSGILPEDGERLEKDSAPAPSGATGSS